MSCAAAALAGRHNLFVGELGQRAGVECEILTEHVAVAQSPPFLVALVTLLGVPAVVFPVLAVASKSVVGVGDGSEGIVYGVTGHARDAPYAEVA